MPIKSILSIQYTNFGPGKAGLQFSSIPIPELFNLDELSQQSGVLEVAFSQVKKTLLLSFNPKKFILADFLSQLKKKIPHLKIIQKKSGGKNAQGIIPRNQGDNFLSQFIWQMCAEGNKTVKTKLDNKADLTSLVPVAFAALGLLEFVRRPVMPKWYDWGWFSYSVFKDLNIEKQRTPHFHSELLDKE